jgi:acyl-CoA thioesterase-1
MKMQVLYRRALILLACCAVTARADDARPVIVTLGDSITKGVRQGVTAEETFAARLQVLLKTEAGVDVEVVNVGIGGERTDQALPRLEKDVMARRPAIVTIMYGTNDSYVDKGKDASRITVDEYTANLRELVKRLRAAGVRPVLMTEPRWGDKASPNGVGEHPNVRLEKYVEACRTVAKESGTPLVDNYAHWSEAVEKGTDVGEWTTDQCHPNAKGHTEIARTMLSVARKAMEGLSRVGAP